MLQNSRIVDPMTSNLFVLRKMLKKKLKRFYLQIKHIFFLVDGTGTDQTTTNCVPRPITIGRAIQAKRQYLNAVCLYILLQSLLWDFSFPPYVKTQYIFIEVTTQQDLPPNRKLSHRTKRVSTLLPKINFEDSYVLI